MLIHLTPQIFADRYVYPCQLVDVRCAELGLSLKNDLELTARRPYPNKSYLVACRKSGQKAMQGLLVETQAFVREFTIVTRWAVAAWHVATHRARYVVLDNEYDTITDNAVLWYAMSEGLGGWGSRWPDIYKGTAPISIQPRMEVRPGLMQSMECVDSVDADGYLIERTETIYVPTLERDRVINMKNSLGERVPGIEAAFR